MGSDDKSSVKCIPFKLSRVRFVTEPEIQYNELIITGSWMEETNRLCLWQYGVGSRIDNGEIKPVSEKEDCITAGVLGDSIDEPRLISSLIYPGSVQDLKVHHRSRRIFSACSNGSFQVFHVDCENFGLARLTSNDWMPFGSQITCGNIPVALSALAIDPSGTQIYVCSDLGQLAVVQLDRIPTTDSTFLSGPCKSNVILMSGSDICTVNAIERVDNHTLASVNQVGQLKVWDIRTGLNKPQRCLLRPGETQPLLCLGPHPGQPHLLAVGGVDGSNAAAYIWDLRAEQYPLTEVACDGRYVWETAFHPRQPKHLYLATETAGLLRISSREETDSWTGFKGSRRKLTVSPALPENTIATDVISFDISNTLLVCGHSDSLIQTVPCEVCIY